MTTEINKVIANKGKKLSIGFIIQSLTGFSGFHEMVWQGMINAAKDYDVNAYIFVGGSIDKTPFNPFEKNLNLVYELIVNKYLDGLIINYSAGHHVTPERLEKFCRNFSLPIVSIIGEIKGFPSVRVDNRKSMSDLILHLINEHNCKKIAFIKGVKGNVDAEERLVIYKDILKECNMPYDPDLVYNGLFDEESGFQAVNYFIKEKKKNFDAIVASNDSMAFGAIKALRTFGKSVPWDIMVTGFDDTEEASAFTPALTTVKQSFNEICSKGLSILCENIRGKKVIETVIVPSQLIIRQSCGCASDFVKKAKNEQDAFDSKKYTQIIENKNEIIDKILTDIKSSVGEYLDIYKENLNVLIEGFIEDVQSEQHGMFISQLSKMFQEKIVNGQDIYIWHNIIYIIRKWIYSIWKDEKLIFTAENILVPSCIMIGELSKQAVMSKKIGVEKNFKELREIGQELITSFDIKQLKEVIVKQLERLAIPSCFISVFRNIEMPEDKSSDSFLIYRNEKDSFSLDKSIKHTTHSLPDERFLPASRRFMFVIHPLNFKKYKLGYIMLELGPESGIIYDTLQVQISSALMGAKLFHESEQTELILKQRGDTIQVLIRPMLDSINKVTNIAKEKIGIINGLVELTKENSEKLNSTNKSIKVMSEKVEKMTDVINIINDISATVNILAINTSIESAHAGQYGKGFLIIAKEIRKLADSIKINSKLISDNLSDIQPNIDISLKAGGDSMETFKRLEKDVFEVAQTLQQITKSMEELSSGSSKILSVMNVSG